MLKAFKMPYNFLFGKLSHIITIGKTNDVIL